jgi:UDP-N-acetylmuramoyl-tripeptide--D-alanyl-D-alanine ligase
VAVFPQQDGFSELWRKLAASRPCLTFSENPQTAQADVTCAAANWLANAWHIDVNTPAGALTFELHIAGRHNAKNALAAITCALAAGVPITAIAKGLENFEPVRGRSRTLAGNVDGHRFTLIDDTYNANPDSVKAAIEVLAELPAPRLLVLGDMGEVGDSGPQFHAEAGAHARSARIENLYTLGDLSAGATISFDGGSHFSDMDALNSKLLDDVKNFNSVLVKGSRFMRMERVVNAIQAAGLKDPIQPQGAACC